MEDAMSLPSIARELDTLTAECRELDARVAATASTLPHEFLSAAAAEVTALLARLDVLAAEVGGFQAAAHALGSTELGLESTA
jgi:hypothetical protein